MNRITIRPALAGDESQIAKVHIQSWQEAYEGLIPQNYLDRLAFELEDRIKMWKRTLANSQRWTWVAEGSDGIVGFILFGSPRDQNRDDFIELGAIYLLGSEKGKGVGSSLLLEGFCAMKELGYQKAYCWVLEGNPTTKFYESSGASFSGNKKEDEIRGKIFNEWMYEWSDLSLPAKCSQ